MLLPTLNLVILKKGLLAINKTESNSTSDGNDEVEVNFHHSHASKIARHYDSKIEKLPVAVVL